jgi:hypothetical protein
MDFFMGDEDSDYERYKVDPNIFKSRESDLNNSEYDPDNSQI